jgi:hypothetical protein
MDIAIILTIEYPSSEWILNGDNYPGLTWLSSDTKPTEKELEQLWPLVKDKLRADEKAKIDDKASAISKLQALGLTLNEVEAAFGLKS